MSLLCLPTRALARTTQHAPVLPTQMRDQIDSRDRRLVDGCDPKLQDLAHATAAGGLWIPMLVANDARRLAAVGGAQ